ncbi:hypothetical protein BHE74_00011685 [Ensete ventricosum]|nr:hypothetical protein BHE74_00011685 [Ensete ventricosum]
MATENPLRFIGNNGAGNWTLKDTSQFASSDNIVSEELGSLLKGQMFHGNKSITGLSRSGSAPPSMEGSRAAFDILEDLTADVDGSLENLSNAAQNCNSEEQLRAHPAYLAYYCANVNLNPRLPPPLISRENRHLMQHNSGFEDNRRMPSFDDSNKASFFVSRPALSTHDEEPEDDRSPRVEHSDWIDKKADVVSGHFTPSGHLDQKDFPQTSSPVYADHFHPSSHIMLEQAPNQDAFLNPLQESSMGMTDPETRSPSIAANACIPHLGSHSVQSMLNDNLGGTPVTCSASTDKTVNLHQGENESVSGSTTLDNSVLRDSLVFSGCGNVEDGLKNLRLSSDGHRRHQPQQYMQQTGIYPQSSSSHAQIDQSQFIVQGHYSQSSGNRFSHGQPKLPSVEVQPLLQSSGIGPLYVTAAAYGTPYYHNLQSSSLLPSQFGISGYALNPSLVTPLVTAYPHHHSGIPVPFENAVGPNFSARASGVSSGGNVSGIDMQHLHKIYGQLGLAIQPPFPDPLYVPFYNYPSSDAYATAGQYDPAISRGGSLGSSPGPYGPQKAPGPAHLPDQRPQVMRVAGVNSLNAITGGTGSPSYYGSSPNNSVLMQFPSSPLASPVFQGSTVVGTSFSGRKNDNIKFPLGTERNAGSLSGWQNQRGREKIDEPRSYSFLEELKCNRVRRYELSDIAGHIVEFRQVAILFFLILASFLIVVLELLYDVLISLLYFFASALINMGVDLFSKS